MMGETKSIVVEYDLPQSPAKVWRALTDAQILSRWLMENDIVAKVGHKFQFRARPIGDWDGIVLCEVLIAEPEKCLRYSWKGKRAEEGGRTPPLETMVTWTLTPKGSGTLLLLEHVGFQDADKNAYEAMSGGWRSHIRDRMAKELTTL